MKTSESIKELAQALAKAQGQMAAALKDSNNPFFKSKYADISSVIDAMRKPFADNGLAFIQAPYTEGDKTYLSARIIHASGEWIDFAGIHVPVVKANDAQALKSGLTYMRRAQMLSVCCIEESDDDGNAAVATQTRQQGSQQTIVQKPSQTSAPQQRPATANPAPKRMSTDEMVKIYNGPVNNAAPPSEKDQREAIRQMGRFDTR